MYFRCCNRNNWGQIIHTTQNFLLKIKNVWENMYVPVTEIPVICKDSINYVYNRGAIGWKRPARLTLILQNRKLGWQQRRPTVYRGLIWLWRAPCRWRPCNQLHKLHPLVFSLSLISWVQDKIFKGWTEKLIMIMYDPKACEHEAKEEKKMFTAKEIQS